MTEATPELAVEADAVVETLEDSETEAEAEAEAEAEVEIYVVADVEAEVEEVELLGGKSGMAEPVLPVALMTMPVASPDCLEEKM